MKRFNDDVHEQMHAELILKNITIYVDDDVNDELGYVRTNNGWIIPVIRSSPSNNSTMKWLLRLDVWKAWDQAPN